MKAFTLLAFAILLACGARASDTIWPAQRGTASARGVCKWVSETPPPEIREWHFRHKSNRRYKTGLAVWASPAVAVVGGRPMAFIGGYDQTMHALDLAAKEECWAKITNGEICDAPAVGEVDGELVVFWGSADRSVYAYAAATGRRVWTRELVAGTSTMTWARLSAPLLHDGTLYVTCFAYDKALPRNMQKGWLCALDMRTGAERWRREVSQGPVGAPVGRRIGGRFIVFVAAQKGLLQALDCTGTEPRPVWTFQMPHEVLGSPAVEEDTERPLLFLGSKFGNLIAIDALTGREVWQRMAGNWIDNTASVGKVDGENIVVVGSHDYNLYAFRVADGAMLWRRHLGGEVFSAPVLFELEGRPAVAACALDNHLYVLDARSGTVITAFYTGQPIWDKVSKGETLWGSPVVFEAGSQTALVHGSFNDTVYVLPVLGETTLRARARSSAALWRGLGIVLVLFLGVVVPVLVKWPARKEA